MDLPFRPGRLAGPPRPLLSLMLSKPPAHLAGHARSTQGGGMGMPTSVTDFQQYTPLWQNNSKGLSWDPSFPRKGGMVVGIPKDEASLERKPTGNLWSGRQSLWQSRPHQNDGQKSAPSHRRHPERGVDAACGKIRSTAWTAPKPVERVELNGSGWDRPLAGVRKRKWSNGFGDVPPEEHEGRETEDLKRCRGSMSKAMEVAKSASGLASARRALTKDFWAASTVRVKRSRRVEVLRLALAVADGEPIFPLRQSVVEGVAAALKAGGMTSANLYLQELKLGHIEAGYDLEAWLARTFTLCGKSLTRNRGPVKRAPEVPVELVTNKLQKFSWKLDVPLAGLAYAWGVAWMLREIELSRVKWEHIHLMEDKKWVRLFLPNSKTDQQGLGVSRTLRCCGEKPCWKGCAWHLAKTLWELRQDLPAGALSDFVFGKRDGSVPSKSEMVGSWDKLLGQGIKGHSARRTGAMAYTRRGMSIQDLSYLGRWKSGVVLNYAEEALESVPANSGGEKQSSTRSKTKASPELIPEVDLTVADVPQVKPLVNGPKSGLWVKSAERGCTAIHLVDNAAWDRPMDFWSTACGWFFARKSARFSFVSKPSLASTKCKKCLAQKRSPTLRDDVKEAMFPAQCVADGFQDKLNRPSLKPNQAGRTPPMEK